MEGERRHVGVAPPIRPLHQVLLKLDPPGLLLPLVLLEDVHFDEKAFWSFVPLKTFLERTVRHLHKETKDSTYCKRYIAERLLVQIPLGKP